MPVAKNRGAFAGRVALLAAMGLAAFGPVPAGAQFGTIFGDPPPRPPGNVPSRPPATEQAIPGQQFPQRQAPQQQQQQQVPQQQPAQSGRQPSGVQSQPLPPPPGAAQSPQGTPLDTRPQQSGPPPQQQQPGQPALSGLPPGQRQPRGTPQPASTVPQPGDEVINEPPSQKIPNGQAVFSGLDKITGRIISFDVALNETVQFGALQVIPRVCYTRPPTEAANTDAFLEVSEVTLQGEVRRIFTGWMFASSPGLHAVEHPIYDIWLTDCKQPLTKVAEEPPAQPAPPAQQRPQQQRPQQQQRPTLPSNVPQQRAFPPPIR